MGWLRHARSPGSRRARGTVTVEFALLLPLLLLLLSGMIDLGRVLNAQITVTQVAREGVRASTLGEDVQSVVQGMSTPSTTLSSVQADPCPASSPGSPPGDTTVVVTAQVTFLTPLPTFVPRLGPSITVTGRAVAQCYA